MRHHVGLVERGKFVHSAPRPRRDRSYCLKHWIRIIRGLGTHYPEFQGLTPFSQELSGSDAIHQMSVLCGLKRYTNVEGRESKFELTEEAISVINDR